MPVLGKGRSWTLGCILMIDYIILPMNVTWTITTCNDEWLSCSSILLYDHDRQLKMICTLVTQLLQSIHKIKIAFEIKVGSQIIQDSNP